MSFDSSKYDTFICHNSDDKPEVRRVCESLEEAGISTWIDEDSLPPGVPWYEYIFSNIDEFGSIIVFVGQSGTGPIQEEEIERVLRTFQRENKPIIPVLLPGRSVDEKHVPNFVREQVVNKRNYVSFESGRERAIRDIVAGIRGDPPETVDLDEIGSVERLPNLNDFVEETSLFALSWAILHWLGFASVNAFTGIEPLNRYEVTGVISTTLIVLLLLLYFGSRQIKHLRIDWDRTGVAIAVLAGTLVSYFMVWQTQNLGFYTSIAGLATTVATAVLAGAAGGAILGVAFALIGGFGSLMAASLTPWFNALTKEAMRGAESLPGILAFSLGAAIWGVTLALALNHVFKNYGKYRRLTSFLSYGD